MRPDEKAEFLVGQWELDDETLLRARAVLVGQVGQDRVEALLQVRGRGAARPTREPGDPVAHVADDLQADVGVVGHQAFETLFREAAEEALLHALGGQRILGVLTEEGLAEEVPCLPYVDQDFAPVGPHFRELHPTGLDDEHDASLVSLEEDQLTGLILLAPGGLGERLHVPLGQIREEPEVGEADGGRDPRVPAAISSHVQRMPLSSSAPLVVRGRECSRRRFRHGYYSSPRSSSTRARNQVREAGTISTGVCV